MKVVSVIVALWLVFSSATYPQNKHYIIKQISIPKCGTHLAAKLIGLLTGKKWVTFIDKTGKKPGILSDPPIELVKKQLQLINTDQFWISHLCYSKECADLLKKAECKMTFLYRDPRDQVVSLAFYITAGTQAKTNWPIAQTMSFNDLILDIITRGSPFGETSPFRGGVVTLYNAYRPWFEEPDVLCLRFEDLIGSRGGGSDELQMQAIKQLLNHLELPHNERMLQQVVDKLFGPSPTFREGKIGSWKKHFTQQHVDVFKAVAGDVLIEWGYEKDYNWGL